MSDILTEVYKTKYMTIYHSRSMNENAIFPPIFCIYNVIFPRFARSRKSKETLKPGNQEKRLQSLLFSFKR